jgi:hypothetical protein
MSEEVRSKSLQRYYDNKEVYNEKAKQYFRSVWYVKNREALLKKQKEYRDSRRKTNRTKYNTQKIVTQPQIINPSLIVSFE